MSDGFRPFFVDLAEDDALVHSGQMPVKGRYLVIAVLSGRSQAPTGIIVELLAYPVDGHKRLYKLKADCVTFAGFRGDCIMCDQRKPEEGP